MKPYFSVIAAALLWAAPLLAQQDSIDYWRTEGIKSFEKQQFEDALTEFRLALTFEGQHQVIDEWIDKTFDGYVVLLKKEMRGSELAGMAYKLARTNPTHALRVAEEAVKLHPNSSSAIQQLHDILSAYPPNFYSGKFVHQEGVSDVAISAGDQLVLTGCMDDTARLWSWNGRLLHCFPHDEPVRDVAFFPDGRHLVTAGSDNIAKIWRTDGTLALVLDGHQADISAAAVSPQGNLIATASWDSTFIVWNREGEPLLSRKAHEGYLSAIAFSPDGQRLATGGWDKTAKVWSLDGTLLHTFREYGAAVSSVAFSNDGKQLVAGSWDGTAKLWSLDGEGSLLTSLKHNDGIQSVAWFGRESAIFTACHDGLVRLWATSGELIREYKGHGGWIWSLCLSEDENYLVSGSTGGEALLWPLKSLESRLIQAHEGPVWGLAFSPDGQVLASAGEDRTVKLWSLDGRLLSTFFGHMDPAKDVAFAPDGQSIASVGNDQVARFWKRDGTPIRAGNIHNGRLESIIFSGDGQHYFTAGWDTRAYCWDLRDSVTNIYAGHRSHILDMALSPDEKWLLTGSRGKLGILQPVADSQAIVVLEGHKGAVTGVAFSPDGQLLATSSADGMGRIWNRKGEEVTLLQGHEDGLTDIQFAPDGRYVLTGSEDGAAKLWDLQGRELQTMRGHTGPVNKVGFSPDGTFMVTAGADGTIRFWKSREQFLNDGTLYALSRNEKYKYGLEEGTAEEEGPGISLNAPFFYLSRRGKLLQQQLAPASYNYYNAHTYSRKAYLTRQLNERLALQQSSLLLASNYKAFLEQRLKESNKEGQFSVNVGIRNTLAFSHSNLAMWLLFAGKYEDAVQHAELAARQNCPEEVSGLMNIRLALALLFREDPEPAFALLRENRWVKLESPGFAQIFGLMTGQELELPTTAGELLGEEINHFQEWGLSHPRLAEFVGLLMVKP